MLNEKDLLYEWVGKIRRDFHMHPELGHQEFRTTDKIKNILPGLGVQLQELPELKTGAVGVISGKKGSKTIALRADIDALPMEEKNDVPYRSVQKGVMHACGHDCHTAIMLGVARKLTDSHLMDDLKGQVKFIFQPAEETISGAKSVIDAGGLHNPKVDRILAGHMDSELPAGQVGLFTTVSHAAADIFRLIIHGKGVHGAHPHSGIDPICAGVSFYNAVQTVISRNLNPLDSAVITVGQFQAGTATNIIPDDALLTGTVRTFKEDVRQMVKRRIKDIAHSLEKSHQVSVDYRYEDGVPVCKNDESISRDLYKAAVSVLGEKNVYYANPQMGSEDFGLFTHLVPGAFMRIGCRNEEKGIIHKVHSPHFDVDEACLAVGVEVFTEAVRAYLK